MKKRKKKLEFRLTAEDRINRGTADPKPSAQVQRPYIQPKPSFIGGRYVLRTKKFVQLETQREIHGVINRIVIIQGEDGLAGYLHFDDGTTQKL